MWVPGTWKTEEDLAADLRILSEIPVTDSPEDTIPPESILRYRKQMEENKLSTLNSDIDETACYVVSGRGRGIRDRVIRPGGLVESDPSDDSELKKQIRQVSGFGYSNALIEQSIRARVYDPGTLSESTEPRFQLVSRSSSHTRSSHSKKGSDDCSVGQ